MTIDRRSITPIYYQVADILASQIQNGEIGAGGKLPSERQLMQTYQLSRNTIRQAINVLVGRGLVYQDHGHGNFAIGTELNIQYRIDTFLEHSEFLRRVGYVATVQVIGFSRLPPDEVVRKALKLESEEEVYCYKKLFLVAERPVIYTLDYIACRQLGPHYDPADSGDDFFELLEKTSGKKVKFTFSDIVSVSSPPDVANRLGLPAESPILLLRETLLDHNKMTPLAFAYNYYHPDIHFQILRRSS